METTALYEVSEDLSYDGELSYGLFSSLEKAVQYVKNHESLSNKKNVPFAHDYAIRISERFVDEPDKVGRQFNGVGEQYIYKKTKGFVKV